MPRFDLRSEWTLAAPIDRVWTLVADSPQYPRWWPGFERADRRPGGVVACRVRSDFGLALAFTQHDFTADPPHRQGFRADGDLVGRGTWELAPRGDAVTVVTMRWQVDLGPRWLRLLARVPAVARLMARSHHRVMNHGRRALERLLADSSA